MQAVTASNQMVVYWGQNSAGDFTNIQSQWEQPLRNYCEDSSFDIIVVGFVYLFPSASGNADPTLPGMNFANHCEVPFDDANPFVLNCTGNVAPDITYCQSRGKKIMLSFGGGVGSYGFTSDSQAVTFANTVWNMFLGGSGAIRPFGNAIFDGVDLDIEGGTQTGYIAFINTLRSYFAASGRQYYISSAPQCFFPDRLGPGAGSPLTEAWFDFIWIQFYNNWCGLNDYPTNFNFATWAAAMSNAANPNVKLFIGAPASALAAASGFVELATLENIATTIQNTFPNIYGGIMVWDASTSDLNGNFAQQVASFVHAGAAGAAATPSAPSTTGAVVVVPSTTGAKAVAAPSTTGAKAAAAPSTTGAAVVAPSTTGSQPIVAPTTPAQPSTTGLASSNSGSCVSGNMKCVTSETYSTCNRGVWSASQSCGINTVCSPSGAYIYCVSGQASTPTAPSTTAAPALNVQPIAPVQPSTTGAAVVAHSTTGAAAVISTPTTPSSTGSCTMGYQRCAGSNTYQTCGNGANGPEWSVAQQCQTGLQCHASATANNIYCY